MSTPILKVFGRELPLYGLLFMTGMLLGGVLAVLRAKKRGLLRLDVAVAACFIAIGGILGAKLLSVLTSIRTIIESDMSFLDVMRSGFVFYGGLIGGALGLLVYWAVYKPKNIMDYYDVFAVSVPLGHALGRVGCFLTGCCYGMEYDGPISVVYKYAADGHTPIGVPLLPIQLIEACCLLLLYAALEFTFFKSKKKGLCLSVYALGYALIRFVLEFFRGDKIRGIYGGLSTSQWISLAVVILWGVGFYLYLRYFKKKPASLPAAAEGEGGKQEDAPAQSPAEVQEDRADDAPEQEEPVSDEMAERTPAAEEQQAAQDGEREEAEQEKE